MSDLNKAYLEKIDAAAKAIEAACGRADIAVILGSGLGGYAEALEDAKFLDYKDIPGFPVSTAPGHAGRWCAGRLHGKRVYMMQGRFHCYEGYDLRDVTMPIRVMKRLGVQTLIVTNAAGGVNTGFAPGDLMLLTDFINLSGKNPLTGPNLDEFGPRFPDMSHAYDVRLMQLAQDVAAKLGIALQKGVYCWMNGPCYESPAEIRMARAIGGDAVGMSTVTEALTAAHCGMPLLCLSVMTNMAAGVLDQPLSGEEVDETAAAVADRFSAYLTRIVREMEVSSL